MAVAGIRGDIPLEDAVDIAGWLVQAGRIPAYLDWSPDAADAARAEVTAAEIVAMGEGFL